MVGLLERFRRSSCLGSDSDSDSDLDIEAKRNVAKQLLEDILDPIRKANPQFKYEIFDGNDLNEPNQRIITILLKFVSEEAKQSIMGEMYPKMRELADSNPDYKLSSEAEMVFVKSDYVCRLVRFSVL